jgi:hypothetical protein
MHIFSLYSHVLPVIFQLHEIESYFPSFLFSISDENSLRKWDTFVAKLSSVALLESEGFHFALLESAIDINTPKCPVVSNSINI